VSAPAKPTASFAPALVRARTAAVTARDTIASWPQARVVLALIVVEWLCVVGLARAAAHNAWTYYQGGDQLWYYTLGWLLSHGHLYRTEAVGYLWSWLLAPLARAAGPNVQSAYPAVILVNVLVLLPAAMIALYALASRIAGRLFGYWTLVLWIAVPFIGVLYTNTGYHSKYTDIVLPQGFGLTAMADFPTMVAMLICLSLCARAALGDGPVRLYDALAAGVAAGAAIALKPSVALILVGPILLFALRRSFTGVATFVAGLAPAVLVLAFWKQRGVGHLPLLASPDHAPAGLAAASPVVALDLQRYLNNLSWHQFTTNLDLLREHFWSGRLIEWLVIAGVIALARMSWRAFALVAGAFLPFLFVKSSYIATIEDTSLFRILIPAFPLFVLCLAALPFLLPGLRAPKPPALRPGRLAQRGRIAVVAIAVALTAVLPAVAIGAAKRSGPPTAAILQGTQMAIPVDIDLHLRARVTNGLVRLTWDDGRPAGGAAFYRLWRNHPSPNQGLTCGRLPGAAVNCTLVENEVGLSRRGGASDRPPPGTWVYRVGVAANWLNDPAQGDVYVASKPVVVRVP
jgi:hypothetical protein